MASDLRLPADDAHEEREEATEEWAYYTMAARWDWGWQPLWQGPRHRLDIREHADAAETEARKRQDRHYARGPLREGLHEVRLTLHVERVSTLAATIPPLWEAQDPTDNVLRSRQWREANQPPMSLDDALAAGLVR